MIQIRWDWIRNDPISLVTMLLLLSRNKRCKAKNFNNGTVCRIYCLDADLCKFRKLSAYLNRDNFQRISLFLPKLNHAFFWLFNQRTERIPSLKIQLSSGSFPGPPGNGRGEQSRVPAQIKFVIYGFCFKQILYFINHSSHPSDWQPEKLQILFSLHTHSISALNWLIQP